MHNFGYVLQFTSQPQFSFSSKKSNKYQTLSFTTTPPSDEPLAEVDESIQRALSDESNALSFVTKAKADKEKDKDSGLPTRGDDSLSEYIENYKRKAREEILNSMGETSTAGTLIKATAKVSTESNLGHWIKEDRDKNATLETSENSGKEIVGSFDRLKISTPKSQMSTNGTAVQSSEEHREKGKKHKMDAYSSLAEQADSNSSSLLARVGPVKENQQRSSLTKDTNKFVSRTSIQDGETKAKGLSKRVEDIDRYSDVLMAPHTVPSAAGGTRGNVPRKKKKKKKKGRRHRIIRYTSRSLEASTPPTVLVYLSTTSPHQAAVPTARPTVMQGKYLRSLYISHSKINTNFQKFQFKHQISVSV